MVYPINVLNDNENNSNPYDYIVLTLIVILVSQMITHIIRRIYSLPTIPPGPFPFPVIGNLLHLGQNPHIELSNMAQTYGPIMSVRLGTKLVVVGSSAEASKEILKTHDSVLSGRYLFNTHPASSPKLNKYSIVFAKECDDQWRYLRSIVRAALISSTMIQGQVKIREKNVVDFLKYLHAREGQVVNMSDLVFKVIFNTMSNILFGKDVFKLAPDTNTGNFGYEVMELINKFFDTIASRNYADLFPVLRGYDIQGKRTKSEEIFEKLFNIWKQILKDRRARTSRNGEDFMDYLLDKGLSDDQINHLLLELLLAGTDTTSTTIVWALADLTKNKNAMIQVRAELQNQIKGNFIKGSDVGSLNYLQACIKETLRLHPPIPFLLPHRATKPCTVMNYKIPINTEVMINTWAMSTDPKIWEDPLSFKPERFIGSGLDYKGFDYQFVPFGSGRRICPGMPMAAFQIPFVVACLVHSFEWFLTDYKDSDDLDMEEVYGLALRKKNPLELVPKAFNKTWIDV